MRAGLVMAVSALALAACNGAPDNAVLAEVEADQVRAAAEAGRVPCALGGATAFRIDCSMERIAGADGETMVLGRDDAGYRRFRVTTDGRGVIAADGSEPARVTIVEDGLIEVAVGADRYRLPATMRRE